MRTKHSDKNCGDVDTHHKSTPHHTLDDFFSRSHRECRGMWQLWEKVMEVVIVKIEKTDTMTNTWGRTKTKTSMPENEEDLLIQCIQC